MPMPVLPAVPSTMTPPGFNRPRSSASLMMNSAARSLTEPPGLRNSALPRMVQPVSSEARRNLISGVLPIEPMKPSRMSMEPRLKPPARPINIGGPFSRPPSVAQCVLDQDRGADRDQADAAECFGEPAEPFADHLTDHDADGRHRECRQSNRQCDDEDVGLNQRQADPDHHRIDARADGGDEECAEGMTYCFRLAFGLTQAFPQQLAADHAQQAERDPMVDGLNERGRGETRGPADERRARLDDAEDKSAAQRFAKARPLEQSAFGQGRCERVRGHAESKNDDRDRAHDRRSYGARVSRSMRRDRRRSSADG